MARVLGRETFAVPVQNVIASRLTLGPDAVHVFYRLADTIGGDEYEAAWTTLPADERHRAGRLVFASDRERFVAAHAMLRRVLSKYDDTRPEAWRFVVNEFGKPALPPGLSSTGLTFNLSHADGLVACIIGRNDVGIDVESIDRRVRVLEIASRFFSPSETAGLGSCSGDQRQARFFELWTLKEAYVKGVGAGLSHPLNSFGFVLDEPSSIGFDLPTPAEADSWYFALCAPSEQHRMALAVRRRSLTRPRVTIWAEPDNVPSPPRLVRETPR